MKRILCSLFLLCIVVISGFPQPLPQYYYYPGTIPVAQKQEGFAFWYGSEFNGRPTASGEIFNSALLTAAHPTLPFGTYVRVTNRYNNRQTVVRINDRGPFSASRIIDVSRAAAAQLDMLHYTGTAPVLVEVIQLPLVFFQPPMYVQPPANQQLQVILAPPETQSSQWPCVPITVTVYPQTQSSSIVFSNKTYRLQVGSYRVPYNAVNTYDKLRIAGLFPEYERSGDFIRVVLKGIRSYEVQAVAYRLAMAGFPEAIIREE